MFIVLAAFSDESVGYYWLLTIYQYIMVLSLLLIGMFCTYGFSASDCAPGNFKSHPKMFIASSCDPVADIQVFVDMERMLAYKKYIDLELRKQH